MSGKAKCLPSQDSGFWAATEKKKNYTNRKKHDTPDDTETKLQLLKWKSETVETQKGRKKKDHRHKSGMSGKAKCLRTQDSGHQVATEKKENHTNCKNTTHQTKQRQNYEPGDGRVKL